MTLSQSRARQCLRLLFVGDALAMPAHWYYDRSKLVADHGRISGLVAPKKHVAGSIMALSSTSGGGRGRDDGVIVGDVINHGKRELWGRGKDYFYHCTLQRGENTLEATIVLRVVLPHVAASAGRGVETDEFLRLFAAFMTTPGSHNDAYASTYLRQFFANQHAGKPLRECADNDGHNTDAIDALTGIAPIVVAALAHNSSNGGGGGAGGVVDREAMHASVERYLRATRRSDALPRFGRVFADMLANLLLRKQQQTDAADAHESPAAALRAECVAAAAALGYASPARGAGEPNPMVACYIVQAFEALLVMTHKYAETPAEALLESVNAGGENVARTAAMGALLGAAWGDEAPDRQTSDAWFDELVFRDEISEAIERVLQQQQ